MIMGQNGPHLAKTAHDHEVRPQEAEWHCPKSGRSAPRADPPASLRALRCEPAETGRNGRSACGQLTSLPFSSPELARLRALLVVQNRSSAAREHHASCMIPSMAGSCVALAKSGVVVGQLSCDVEVARVPSRLLDHVQDDRTANSAGRFGARSPREFVTVSDPGSAYGVGSDAQIRLFWRSPDLPR
jgi:hypothetical protein